MFKKFYNSFGVHAEQRERNFSHAVAAAAIVIGGLVYTICS